MACLRLLLPFSSTFLSTLFNGRPGRARPGAAAPALVRRPRRAVGYEPGHFRLQDLEFLDLAHEAQELGA